MSEQAARSGPRAFISGVGAAVPSQVVTNEMLSEFMDTSDEWIQQRSGIRERRWARRGFVAEGECSNVDLVARATDLALKQAGLSADDLGAIIYATITADNEFPGSGAALLKLLGIRKTLPIYEVRNQCAGFIYSLLIARTLVESRAHKHVLVVGMELQSTGLLLSTAGRNTAVLFGDGGGAAVVSASEQSDRGILGIKIASDGAFAEKLGLLAPGFARGYYLRASDFEGEESAAAPRMDGKLIFKMASSRMPEIVRATAQACGVELDEISLVIPHQANQRILDMLAAELGGRVPVYSNIAKYGNTTAGSIPLAMAEAVTEGVVRRGDLICLVSFGAGFSWGAVLLRW